MRFAALGRTRWLRDAIIEATRRGHECRLIATSKASSEYNIDEDDFRRLAGVLGARFMLGPDLGASDAMQALAGCGADAAISVNWITLVPERARRLFPRGVWNAHAGDLPRYRGNACPNWAIIAGEPAVTVTIHEMADALDAGDIVMQSRLAIDGRTYVGDIYAWLDREIPRLFVEALDALEAGGAIPRPQPSDPALSLRCFPRRPTDSMIDWTAGAEHVGRLVRASAEPFAGAFTYLDGCRLIVWRAAPVKLPYQWLGVPGQVAERSEDGSIVVLCGQDALRIELVEHGDGGRHPPGQIIRSLRTRLGIDLADVVARLAQSGRSGN